MAWTRIDDKFLMNPKVQSAGAYGMALYLAGLIYANTNLTDGFIVESMLPVLCGMAYQTPSKGMAQVLVNLNLWEKVEGGYQIHDFLEFNKSREQIKILNKQASGACGDSTLRFRAYAPLAVKSRTPRLALPRPFPTTG